MSESEDKVISEVHTFLVTSTELKPIQKSSNRIAKLVFALPTPQPQRAEAKGKGSAGEVSKGIEVDSDGDLVLSRNPKVSENEESVLFLEFENETTLGLVGLQLWRGAFLLGDYILHFRNSFENKTILELGAGTGMTSVVASIYAKRVISTDLNQQSIMDLIAANATHNKSLVKGEFLVRPVDFTNLDWSPEIEDLIQQADVVLAADVIYYIKITTAFIQTLKKVLACGKKPKDVYIAVEKRYVFTVSDLDTVSPMYSHFIEELDTQLSLSPGCAPKPLQGSESLQVTMEMKTLDFPQYFNYERTKELVLLHIKTF